MPLQPAAWRGVVAYLGGLTRARLVLWCYLIWYLVVLARYFEPQPRLWLSSLGISGIMGFALYLSTARSGKTQLQLERWQLYRFFLMPFCVSSFAALIKDRGFILVFHPTLADNLIGAACCAAFVGAATLARPLAGASVPWAARQPRKSRAAGENRAPVRGLLAPLDSSRGRGE